jgi:ADP-ribose pyrophosphatase
MRAHKPHESPKAGELTSSESSLAQQDVGPAAAASLESLRAQTGVPRPRARPGGIRLHKRARSEDNRDYAGMRTRVPDDRVPWSVDWPTYEAIEFTHRVVLAQPVWADAPDPLAVPRLKTRHSHEQQPLVFRADGRPLNPYGRTGTSGRGILGKWGPNKAVDPIVVRPRPLAAGSRLVFQLVVIKRRDSGQWAIPGGMVDDGELVSQTLRREFTEEAAAVSDPVERAKLEAALDQVFGKEGELIFEGYVDDPRNTDHAWMETTATLFLLTDELGAQLPLVSGSDAQDVKWLDIDDDLLNDSSEILYADHLEYLKLAIGRIRELHEQHTSGPTPRAAEPPHFDA